MVYRAKITNLELYVKADLSEYVVNYCKDENDIYAEFRDENIASFVDDMNKALAFVKSEARRANAALCWLSSENSKL